MPLAIKLKFPQELIRIPKIRKRLWDVAYFVRDLWLARAPYRTGEYARGLQKQNSIKISNGEISITNFAPHAQWYENGHRSFNIAERILAGSKGVKTSKDGWKYKVLRIPDMQAQTRFRSSKLDQSVQKAFGATIPQSLGARVRQSVYKSRKALQKPLTMKTKKNPKGGGILVISERTQRLNPTKWQMPATQGKKIATNLQREVMPILNQAVSMAIREYEQDKDKKIAAPTRRPVTAVSRKAVVGGGKRNVGTR